MTVYRRQRLLCFALMLCLLCSLIPAGMGRDTAARADNKKLGVTLDKVNVRYGASTGEKIIFSLPKDHVCEILDEKNAEKIHWYRVSTTDPSRKNSNTYFGYIHGDFFRELTEAEYQAYYATGSAATPTPVPEANGNNPTPTPTPAPAGTTDLTAKSGTRGVVTAGGTNFREGPGTGYHSLMKLDRNTQVEILTIPSVIGAGSGTFFKVRYDGVTGYIMSDFISILSGGAENGEATVATPTPTPANKNSGSSTDFTHVKLILSSCHLRTSPNGDYDPRNDWTGQGSILPLAGNAVKQGGYTWYPVSRNGKTYYVRNDCVQPFSSGGGSSETPTPAPEDTPTGWIKTTAGGVNLRKNAGYSDVIGTISRNVVLPYYGYPSTVKGVKWYEVKHPTLGKGFLHGNYVTQCNEDGSPLVTPTPAPSITSAPINGGGGGNGQEASYTTLKTGSTGNAVKNLVQELINQGYYSGSVTNKYTTAVAEAVKNFQKANGLSADGIAGATTQHKLFGTVPVGTGDTSNLTMTIYPAEKIDWYTGGINEMWPRGANYKVYDVKTGIVWWAHRWAGGRHVDAEPLTAADTARLCKCYGVSNSTEIAKKNLYQRRPLLVTIGTRTFACSLYGVPHNYPEGDTISTNDFKGQVCIHFTNSRTHDSNKVDSGHEQAIEYAWEHAPNGHK